jgi:hypothetical protein
MPQDYSQIVPFAPLVQQVSPTGPGLANPPEIDQALRSLGIQPQIDKSVDVATALSKKQFSPTLNADNQKQKGQSTAPFFLDVSQESGSFFTPTRRPFALTCQRWLNARKTIEDLRADVQQAEQIAANNKGTNREAETEKQAKEARDNYDRVIKNNTDNVPSRRFIYCRVNPAQISWSVALRVADQKTLAGTVQHAWRPAAGVRRRTYFSEPVLGITFQSGNIMPVVTVDGSDQNVLGLAQVQMPTGLQNFYDFMDLVNDSRILDDETAARQTNVVYIMYTSKLFPSMVLAGMFDPSGISLTESATDPNQVQWTCQFTVYDSYPRFDRGYELIQAWQNQGFGAVTPQR